MRPWHRVRGYDEAAGDDKVALMTLHAAKGLEFDTVFLPGWEEGLFPNQRSLDEGGAAALEEERRLAYVGLTRARQRAVVSYAANRLVYGYWQNALPSRTVRVDGRDVLHVDYDVTGKGPTQGAWSGSRRYANDGWGSPAFAPLRRVIASPETGLSARSVSASRAISKPLQVLGW